MAVSASTVLKARPFVSCLLGARLWQLHWRTQNISKKASGMAGLSSVAISAGKAICQAAVESVSPQQLVRRAVRVEEREGGTVMCVEGREYQLSHNVKVIAFGKAVLGMVACLESLLGEHIVEGVASVPVGSMETAQAALSLNLPRENSHIRFLEGGANNLPDVQSHHAAKEALAVANKAVRGDIVVALISGGGSALLPCPVEGVTLEDKRRVTEDLAMAGATIYELNSFRKYLSQTKGGKLAEAVFPAQMVAIILSDVINDPLHVIASGPSVPSTTTSADIMSLLEKYQLSIPPSVEKYLDSTQEPSWESISIAPIENGSYCHVQNVIVGNNSIATAAAAAKASEMSYRSVVWSHAIQGEARLLGEVYAMVAHMLTKNSDTATLKAALSQLKQHPPFVELIRVNPSLLNEFERLFSMLEDVDRSQGLCLLSGGEPTVTVGGDGKGGRNQEMVLAFLVKCKELEPSVPMSTESTKPRRDFCLFSLGTDGQDGPTDAAGAVGHPSLIAEATVESLDAENYLTRNDSYSYFSRLRGGRYHLKTGLTGTNVMDLHLMLITG